MCSTLLPKNPAVSGNVFVRSSCELLLHMRMLVTISCMTDALVTFQWNVRGLFCALGNPELGTGRWGVWFIGFWGGVETFDPLINPAPSRLRSLTLTGFQNIPWLVWILSKICSWSGINILKRAEVMYYLKYFYCVLSWSVMQIHVMFIMCNGYTFTTMWFFYIAYMPVFYFLFFGNGWDWIFNCSWYFLILF